MEWKANEICPIIIDGGVNPIPIKLRLIYISVSCVVVSLPHQSATPSPSRPSYTHTHTNGIKRRRRRDDGVRNSKNKFACGKVEKERSKKKTCRVAEKLVPDEADESCFEDAVDCKQLPIIDVVVKVQADPTALVAKRLVPLIP